MELDAVLSRLSQDRRLFIALFILIIIVTVWVRTGLLSSFGLFEPDAWFYYAVVRQTVQNNFIENSTLAISGFPSHNFIGEAPGLPYITVALYFFLRFLGISYYDIMRNIAMLFGVLDGIGAYFLARYMTKSRWLSLFSMLFVALSNGNTARTGATIYRGDTFISAILLLSLILMLASFESDTRRRKFLLAGLSGFVLSVGYTVWNGAPFTTAIYFTAIALMLAYAFIIEKKEYLYSIIVLMAGLFISYMLINLYVALGTARPGLALAGASFFLLFAPLLAFGLAAYYLHGRRLPLVGSVRGRFVLICIAALVVALLILVVAGSFVGSIYQTVVGTTNIGATTQELAKPSFDFLFYSFGIGLYLAPIGILLFLIFGERFGNSEHLQLGHFRLNVNMGFLAILAYLIVTAYLQSNAIRYNSVLSIPVAILSGYAFYAVGRFCLDHKSENRLQIAAIIVPVLLAYLYLYLTYESQYLFSTQGLIFWLALGAAAASVLTIAYLAYSLFAKRLNLKYLFISLLIVACLYSLDMAYINVFTSVQADDMNPLFYSAISWLGNNTAPNARVLAVWTDGSVVEGLANRTSYIDSVGGENGTRILNMSRFLFGLTNGSYLYDIGKPNYIVARQYWFGEESGIAAEGNVPNFAPYFFITMAGLNESSNGTSQYYYFHGFEPSPTVALLVIKSVNGTNSFAAYVGTNQSKLYLTKSVIFYNSQTYNYSIINTSSSLSTVNSSLMVSYVIDPATGRSAINGATILGSSLLSTNLFRLTYLCNYDKCAFSEPNVTARAVYINNDTRIIELNYT